MATRFGRSGEFKVAAGLSNVKATINMSCNDRALHPRIAPSSPACSTYGRMV